MENNQNDIDFNELNSILDRTIHFAERCDNKASIVFGFLGIIITILLSNEDFLYKTQQLICSFPNDIKSIAGWLSFISLLFCFYFLFMCIFARTNAGYNSLIFFGTISLLQNSDEYISMLNKLSDKEYREDIIRQIFINAVICTKKFRYFNKALCCILIGVCFFLIYILI